MDFYLAGIILWAANFAPRGWVFCDGQLLSIAQNTALFSLLGTTFGGNGQTTFGIPDLRGRVPLHPGQGPGLSAYVLGQPGGVEANTILVSNMPIHNHPLNAISEAGNTSAPAGAYLSNTGALDREYNTNNPAGTMVTMNAGVVGPIGGSLPVNNLQPYLAVNFILCTQGIFPSRN